MTTMVGLIGGLALSFLLACLALINLVDGLWRLAATIWVRRWTALPVTGVLATLLVALLEWLAPALDIPAHVMAVVLLLPWPAAIIIAWLAFRLDGDDRKARAFQLRRELNERNEEAGSPSEGFWLGYVFDAARAERRTKYQPPPL